MQLKTFLKKLYENGQISIAVYTAAFFLADFLNGVYGYSIDIYSIMMMYGVIAGRDVLNYNTDSRFNSLTGSKPEKNIGK